MNILKTKLAVLLTVVFLFLTANHAVSQQAMGKWQIHFGYNASVKLAQTNSQVYVISSGALFSVDKTDQSIEQYSKVTGLNDDNLFSINYDTVRNQLLLVYSDGNIDIMTNDNGVVNIPDFYNKQSTIDKTLNSVSLNGIYAYLSCNYGILVVNLEKQEIADSYVIGANGSNVAILATAVLGSNIYALTSSGLEKASLSSYNLADFQNWTNISTIPSGTNSNLVSFANALWLLQNGQVYKSSDGVTWTSVTGASSVARIQSDGAKLYFISDASTSVSSYDTNLQMITLSGIAPQMINYDTSSKDYWYVKGDATGVTQADNSGQTLNTYKPSGPYDNTAWDMTFAGNKLFVVPGGAWASQYFHPASVMMYENSDWSYIAGTAIAPQTTITSLPIYDFVSVAADPSDNTHFYVVSYGMGLYEFRNNQFYKWYNSQNSAIESIFPGQSIEMYYQRLDGLAIDKLGNVWFTNGQVSNGIKYLTTSGTIVPYAFGLLSNKTNIHCLQIDHSNVNRKWGTVARYTPGVFVFDDNGTLDNAADDKQAFFTSFTDQDGNTFTSDTYKCLVQDNNNKIWVGTSSGPIVISNPDNVFNSGFTITRIKIPRNDGTDLADYLLGTEQITAMVVDGANRKWIGTATSGLYLVSDDGLQTISHFTAANSPLLSDNILSLALNGNTGELFIGTDLGLISYQTDATTGSNSFTNMYAYPNPVRESYAGLITITGLLTGSIVKITDVAGNLIYETTSNGGLATWNGNRAGGKRVSTGVYLVLAVAPDGNTSGTTKILVIN